MFSRDLALSVTAATLLVATTACKKQPRAATASPLHVAAASDLRRAAPELGMAFTKKTGSEVTFTFAASGILARQLGEGAPYGVFLSASKDFALAATTKPNTCDATSLLVYAHGSLVLWAPPGKTLPATFDEITDPRYARIAIANPEHAPYGRAAKQALTRRKLWPGVETRVVTADSVDQALSFAKTGNADLVLASNALLEPGAGSSLAIPTDLYDPLAQAAVRCSAGDQAVAKQFLAFLQGPEGSAVLGRYGFSPP